MFFFLVLFFFASASAGQRECDPGTFFNGSSCETCPTGTYQFKSGQRSCKPCPAGTYYPFTGGLGLDVCLPCPKDTFNDKEGATSMADCKSCPTGTASAPYSSRCLSCPAGTQVKVCDFESEVVNGRCFGCYRFICYEQDLETFCSPCRKNYFAPKPNSRKCSVCPLDSESGLKSATCRKCPKKGCQGCNAFEVYDPTSVYDEPYVAFDKIRSSGCRPCPAGFVGNKEVNATRCVRCAPGTFKNDTTTGSCVPCDSDPATIESGSSCTMCNKQQKFNPALQICEGCPRNQESDGGRETVCRPCPRGAIGTRNGCECIPGWVPDGRGGCRICPPGTTGPYFGDKTCSKCYAGSIAPSAGTPHSRCQPCPNGKVSNHKRTKCIACPDGLKVYNDNCVSPRTNCAPGKTRENSRNAHTSGDFSCK